MNNSTVDYKVAQETAVLRADYRFLPAILGRSLFMKVLNYVRSTGFSALDLSPRFVNGISSRSFDRLAGSSDPLADSRGRGAIAIAFREISTMFAAFDSVGSPLLRSIL